MNKIYSTSFVVFSFLSLTFCCTDRRTEFQITTFNLDDSIESEKFNDWRNRNIEVIQHDDCMQQSPIIWDSFSRVACFYQDEHYRVFGTTMGEWGGTIVFEDKSSEFSYMISSYELLMVNYQDSAYYITAAYSQAEYGHTSILRIENPRELIKIRTQSMPRNQHSRDSILEANTTYLKELKTRISLLDTPNLTASLFYPYRNHNYLVYSAKHAEWKQFDEIDSTYLGEIIDHKLVTIDMILPFPTTTIEFKPNRVINDLYSYNYDTKIRGGLNDVLFIDSHGSIFIKGDSIVIGNKYYDDRRKR